MSLRRRIDEARLAVMLLTRLPLGRLAEPVPSMGAARWAFPLVGLPVGLVGWAVLALGLPGMVGATLALAAMALLTGGLHHDGLADFADGMGGRDRAQRLEIMRDSRVGSFGAIVLIFTVLLGVAALAEAGVSLPGILLVAMASRLLMLLALDLLPPARADGLGRGAAALGERWAWGPGAAALLILALWLGAGSLAVLGVMALTASLLGWQAKRLLGGQTGDVLGAVQLGSETAGWVALAALA